MLGQLTLTSALCELADLAESELLSWKTVREWLGPADIVLDQQAVPGIAEDGLTIVLEVGVLASTKFCLHFSPLPLLLRIFLLQ